MVIIVTVVIIITFIVIVAVAVVIIVVVVTAGYNLVKRISRIMSGCLRLHFGCSPRAS